MSLRTGPSLLKARCIALALAGVCLFSSVAALGIGCPPALASAPYKYVALGDSYSAGEGVDPYFRDGYDPKAHRQTGTVDNRCHRSTRAYSEAVQPPGYSSPLYSLASSGQPGVGKRVNKYRSDANVRSQNDVTWAFLACSGATVKNLLPKSQGGAPRDQDQSPQLDAPALDASTSLVTVTIGGNDVGFSSILKTCAEHSCATTAESKSIDSAIASAGKSLDKLYPLIRAKAPSARVIVLGYPMVFPGSAAEQGCTKLRPWRKEQDMLRAKEQAFNALIEQKAGTAGFDFIDLASVFAGHEPCGTKGEWINGPSFTDKAVSDDESFHPNLTGQAQIALAINELLAQPLAAPTPSPVPAPAPVPVLGISDFLLNGSGWGTASPTSIFNGGDPSGSVSNITWTGWGTDTATGYGLNPIFRPGGGYYTDPGTIELVASKIGTCPSAPTVPAYTRLMARVSEVPGGPLGHWFPWALSLCDWETAPATCDSVPPANGVDAEKVTTWDTDCATARKLAAATLSTPIQVGDAGDSVVNYDLTPNGFDCTGFSIDEDDVAQIYWSCVAGTAVVTFREIEDLEPQAAMSASKGAAR